MANFSFDIESTYDKAEMNNVHQQVARDISTRWDFKGTPAEVDWLGEKTGFVITAANDMHLEAIVDIVRRALISRGQSTKVLDLTKEPVNSNMKLTQEAPFLSGLDGDKAKAVTKRIRDNFPKAKPQIQGDIVRVSSSSKDELQKIMQNLKSEEFDFPLTFTNFR